MECRRGGTGTLSLVSWMRPPSPALASLRIDSLLLPPDARRADEKDLRRILEQIRRQPSADLQQLINARFERDDYKSRATFLLNLALTQLHHNGKIAWLFEDDITDHEPLSDQPAAERTGVEVTTSGEAVFNAALGLSTDELLTVANALLNAAKDRHAQQEQDQLVARRAALEQLSQLTDVFNETKQRIEITVVEAKESGASWTQIGEACGIRRDVAHKRWANIANKRPNEAT